MSPTWPVDEDHPMRPREILHVQIRKVAHLSAQPVNEDNGRSIAVFDVVNTVGTNVDEPALRGQRLLDTAGNVQRKNDEPDDRNDAYGDDGQGNDCHVLTFVSIRALALALRA